ncbi:bifunctional heptose 7-phosphate kinase/heptose 1-phosphate adenyltransferase [Flexithrix dorotheae]|uniref:bifunctional heptose 7-phosphate kinase/heptose 1-phosphate adenyltransferase n=1 Tax=Flexithrix dorotheae TaxID=70993 RepID=UPI00037C6E09|nr:PfkB family carbohydrate kinase [Flexithrix dorotheae]
MDRTSSYQQVFTRLSDMHIAVIGDFAVDIYYNLAKETGEISIETGKPVHRGSSIRTSLGAAGNLVNNLKALGVGKVSVFGIVKNDIYGRELKYLLQKLGTDTTNLLHQEDWDSCAYIKPMLANEEDFRLDFGALNKPSDEIMEKIHFRLKEKANNLNVVFINQQFPKPLLHAGNSTFFNQLKRDNPHCEFIADMRHFGDNLRGIILKVNTDELARRLNVAPFPSHDKEACITHGNALMKKVEAPILLTRGEDGMMYFTHREIYAVDAIPLSSKLDTVGAGDTAGSVFSVCYAASKDPQLALEIANLAAAVSVQKLFQTGTASPKEIIELYQSTIHSKVSD